MTTVLITGANRGIGLELARQYAETGAHVIACCRKPQRADDLSALAGAHGERVEIVRLDVTDATSIELLGRRLDGGPIDILINNAGVMGGDAKHFGDIDTHAWAHCLTVNLMGPVRICETLAANVAASGLKKIVNISSQMGSITNAGGGSYIYRTSKAALNMASRLMARDLAEKGIIVLAVHPGWVQTAMGGEHALLTPKDSVTGLRTLIDRADTAMSGRFWAFSGEELPF